MERGGGTVFKKEGERGGTRERENVWPDFWPAIRPDPRYWPGWISRFRPPHRPSLASIWSLEADRHILAVLVAETDQKAGDLSSKTRSQDPFSPPLIPPDFWHTTTWNLFLSLALSFPDQHCHLKRLVYRRSTTEKLADFGASIRRWHRAWRLTVTTIGLTEV